MSGGDSWNRMVADVLRTSTSRGREVLGLYSLEGTRLHERALRAGCSIRRVLISDDFGRNPESRNRALLGELQERMIPVIRAPDWELRRLTGGREIGAIVGLADLPDRDRPLAEVISAWRALHPGRSPLVLAGVDLEDPGNLGALVRTALASGAAAFITIGKGDPFHPQSVRTSMGSLFKTSVILYRDLDSFLGATGSMKTYAAVSTGGEAPENTALSPGGAIILMGSESRGLAEEVSERADSLITIPMPGSVDSYSVNAAAAILLHVISVRQEKARRSG